MRKEDGEGPNEKYLIKRILGSLEGEETKLELRQSICTK
jgi:hypothetical protein